MNEQPILQVNIDAIKKRYEQHTSQCQKIAKEVEKWGKKQQPNLSFLKNHR